MSVDELIDEVRRRRTPDEALHLTAIGVLTDSGLVMGGGERMTLALAGWSAVRAEGATDTYPTLSVPSLSLIRSGVTLNDRIFQMLPRDDRATLVCIGFLGLVGERLRDEPPATHGESLLTATRSTRRRGPKRPAARPADVPIKPRRRRPTED